MAEEGTMVDDRVLLEFEAAWPGHTAAKGDAIHRDLDLSVARYYQRLHRAARSLEGQAHDPLTAHRVVRSLERSAVSTRRSR